MLLRSTVKKRIFTIFVINQINLVKKVTNHEQIRLLTNWLCKSSWKSDFGFFVKAGGEQHKYNYLLSNKYSNFYVKNLESCWVGFFFVRFPFQIFLGGNSHKMRRNGDKFKRHWEGIQIYLGSKVFTVHLKPQQFATILCPKLNPGHFSPKNKNNRIGWIYQKQAKKYLFDVFI